MRQEPPRKEWLAQYDLIAIVVDKIVGDSRQIDGRRERECN
jgi:hypothetical protein